MKQFLFSFLFFLPFVLSAQIDLSGNWKFKTGDDLAWAKPETDDHAWTSISPKTIWEQQGFDNYNGYAWYRIHFKLPTSLRTQAALKDSIRILLGKIDDCDVVYLNGVKIGQTGSLPEDKGGYVTFWNVARKYMIAGNHPALRWDAENVLAVRAYDGGGGSGMFDLDERSFGFSDLIDYIRMDASAESFSEAKNDQIEKKVSLENRYSQPIEGVFTARVYYSKGKGKPGWELNKPVVLKPKEAQTFPAVFPKSERAKVVFTFTEKKTGKSRTATQETAYILTPKESPNPRINNAEVYGARPGVPFLYAITATGNQPMQYAAKGLPKGLKLDPGTGLISGSAAERGMFPVTLTATNALSSHTKVVHIIIGDNICLTPPLGWNSWNCWGLSVSDAKVKSSADAMVNSGLARHGWTYMNIDDGWEAEARNAKTGEIVPNDKFPNMKGLSDYLHARGLKMGIYSSPGTKTCGGYLGTYQHEEQDAQSWAKWGVDYIKYDWCSYELIAPKPTLAELKKPYEVMRAALNTTSRDIVYSLCQYGMGDVWEWGDQVGGNLWRTTGDIVDTWESLSGIGFNQTKCGPHARPGHWNDPDMMIVGKVGWGESLHPTRLTPSEQYTHVSLWAMLSAPMLIGCDLSKIDEFTYNLLANDEVIAIDQDALGKQATQVIKKDDYQIWVKELSDGSRAVGIFNTGDKDRVISVNWADLGLKGFKKVRDVWRQKDVKKFGKAYAPEVFSHGVMLVRVY
jgi:hypothetical protein